mmetsp:Transcript_43730/g.72678  ORF Transcript_43730/g.72678 Transcript_43730/m.72678 type:complete len:101 (+) Transcript_43730:754-1056(+)
MLTAGWNVSNPSASSLWVSSGLKFQISRKLARPAQRSGCGCSAHLKKKALSLPRQTAYNVDWFNESRRAIFLHCTYTLAFLLFKTLLSGVRAMDFTDELI